MGKIRVLSEDIANKIAAGEVVERPSSAVKELVENSIDAASKKISVVTQHGGKYKIIVIDNGTGMDYDDVLLAFERHSTSKIKTIEDLHQINTLGFRGEALPSIASVSHFILESRIVEEDTGARIIISGGKIRKIERIACPHGTRIEISNLFFNIPARKKFLKSAAYESSLITNIMTNYSLAYPEIHFYLEEIPKIKQDYPPVSSIEERIFQIYGQTAVDQSIPLSIEQANIKMYGRIGFPHFLKPNRNSIHFFVNKRYVRDRLLMGAFLDSYKPFLKKDAFPFIIAFIDLPPDLLDVNVHPTKTEIRFYNPNWLYNVIKDSINEALGAFKPVSIFPLNVSSMPSSYPQNNTPIMPVGQQDSMPEYPPNIPQSLYITSKHQEEQPGDSLLASPIHILAQYKNCYILASDNDGILIIDQHVAHERILYEQYKKLLEHQHISIQHLLLPLPIEVTPSQKILITEHKNYLNQLGFILENFGGNTFLLKGIPSFIRNVELSEMIIAIIDDLQNTVRKNNIETLLEDMIASVSCRAAIKINTQLNKEKMQYLVEALLETSMPQYCPHGRPIIMKITDHQINKTFKRTPA
ncbi:MAG: hypothetical protein A2Y62_02415 [Candidatus Fischerbacteria bacterium RBG_13_37_8]|uniref:DNA mismatch repair protein MutL n=1 Tax=Candidatus Fischerbacteria bacterium RBG_13_37_8 TaxID=1817863 RepID=A0A1F5VJD6_9BACT|nr:MAG: hypothetical protein A2Y62_02415 [Candidatus Fischerbacteria bacterium RBG_13_37_8]